MNILIVFCQVDDFCQVFEPKFNQQLPADGKRKRIKSPVMPRSEVMTILIAFHRSGFRNLKTFYNSMIGARVPEKTGVPLTLFGFILITALFIINPVLFIKP